MPINQLTDTFKIANIMANYLMGELDPPSQKALETWISQSENNRALFLGITDEKSLAAALSELERTDTEFGLLQVKARMYAEPVWPAAKKSFRLWYQISAAAAVLFILGIGLFYYSSNSTLPAGSDFAKNDIVPGGNKAYLTLTNGKRIALTDAVNGQLAKETGIEISKTADGQIVYRVTGKGANHLSNNSIETPRGGQYQVILPDGSSVWLNAASKLVYPVSFSGEKIRKVELIGEAYFEIAKDKNHPFVVKTIHQEVEVLGTHFNVNSYPDEPTVSTTLLEGSVRVLQKENGKSILLKPGQQSAGTEKGISITDGDPEVAVAWKNGDFVFRRESLGSLMRQISRWYDVDVNYTDQASKEEVLSGYISRSRKISAVLERIQRIGKVKFKLAGRTITVEPNT